MRKGNLAWSRPDESETCDVARNEFVGRAQEPIQILHWRDLQESLRLLAPHQNHPHIKRMILEIEGREEEAAALR